MYKKLNYAKGLLASTLADDGDSFSLKVGHTITTDTGDTNIFVAVLFTGTSPEQDTDRELIKAYRTATNDFAITERAEEGTSAEEWAEDTNVMLIASADVYNEYETEVDAKANTDQSMHIGTTSVAINRDSAAQGLTGITGLNPGANFTLTQNSVVPFTSVESGAVVDTLYLKEGNVGIGTTEPLERLHVQTGGGSGMESSLGGVDGIIIDTSPDRTGGLNFYTPSDRRAGIFWHNPEGFTRGLLDYNHDDDSMRFFTDNEEKVRINNDGNVGIGTTSPTAYLNIKAGTASVGTAPIKLTSGTLNTTPEAGAIEYDGTDFYLTVA